MLSSVLVFSLLLVYKMSIALSSNLHGAEKALSKFANLPSHEASHQNEAAFVVSSTVPVSYMNYSLLHHIRNSEVDVNTTSNNIACVSTTDWKAVTVNITWSGNAVNSLRHSHLAGEPYATLEANFDVSNHPLNPVHRPFVVQTKHDTWPGLSQNLEDLWVFENWFYGLTGGIVVESGALDGVSFSNSYFFHHVMNWTSINVEADLRNFEKLAINRPNSINVHTALCSEPSVLHWVQHTSLGQIDGIYEFMPESYLKQWHSSLQKKDIIKLPQIACIPSKLLFSVLGLHRIDLWILDVEGAELEVLKGTDFELFDIKSMVIECDDHDVTKDKVIVELLQSKGYHCTKIGGNCYFKHKSLVPSVGIGKTFSH